MRWRPQGRRRNVDRGRTGRVFSRERPLLRSADAVRRSRRPYRTRRQRKDVVGLRSVRETRACANTPRARTGKAGSVSSAPFCGVTVLSLLIPTEDPRGSTWSPIAGSNFSPSGQGSASPHRRHRRQWSEFPNENLYGYATCEGSACPGLRPGPPPRELLPARPNTTVS
jgi:hypothetical protein